MEEKETISTDHIVRDGENPSRSEPWISPEVALAVSGEEVDFSKDLSDKNEDSNDAG